MAGYIALAIVTLAVFAFVLRPLLSPRRESPVVTPERIIDLRARRGYILDALRDVDFDRHSGKLSDEEYQEVRSRYVQEAALVLRDLEQLERAVDEDIETEIAQLRKVARAATQPPSSADRAEER